jgi:hypothetical protein
MAINKARFVRHTIASGGTVDLQLEWQSTANATLFMNYNCDHFTLDPQAIDLPANNAGVRTVAIRFTKHAARGACDVNFVFGASHDLHDTVDVT